MSQVTTFVNSSPFQIQPNTFEYFISGDLNLEIRLPNISQQKDTETINIINKSANPLVVKDFGGVNTVVTLQNNSQVSFLVNKTTNPFTWQQVTNGSTSDSSNFLAPIIPILIDNPQTNNNQFFGASAFSSIAGTQPFNPFSTGGLQYWGPNTATSEFLTITGPTPYVARAILLQFRGASSTNYFNGLTLSASVDGLNFDILHTPPLTACQSTAVYYAKFNNEKPYNIYRINITNSVGTLANLGIFNMQLYGYYK